MKPLISVIIPVYQVEPYLRRAVDSVLKQTYRNLDIILVDDGSKDRCPKICDEYAAKEARVRVIHKENGGLSDARNAGLAVAGGDYIAFLDSDDFWAPAFIEILFDALQKNEAQVAQCSYSLTGPGLSEPDFEAMAKTYFAGGAETEVCDRAALLKNQYDAFCKDATYYIVAWNKLYDARLWKDIRFPKGRIHEDEATTYKVFDKAERGVYVKLPLYGYYATAGSITRERFTVRRLDWMLAMTDRIRYFEKQKEWELAKAGLRARADGSIKYFYPLRRHVRDCKKEQALLRDYVREAIRTDLLGRQEERHFLSLRQQLAYRLFLCAPEGYRKLLRRQLKNAAKKAEQKS